MRLATYLLALQRIPRVGTWTAVQVTRAFPSPDALLAASDEELVEHLGRRFAGPFMGFTHGDWAHHVEQAETQISLHLQRGVNVVAIDDEEYPPLLRLAPSPASVLYVRGDAAALRSPTTVAVIGTREPTDRGMEVALRVARAMAAAGFTIVSGLARGIDTAGHRGALEVQGTTVAILGSAIDKVTPVRNRDLADEIIAHGGAVMSEYPIGFPTSGRHFVERDRLQAGMSIGVIAVQTGVEGGTLHTVRFAREAGRLIAVPRPIPAEMGDPAYGGILNLMEEKGVIVVEGAPDYGDLQARLQAHRDRLLMPRAAAQSTAGTLSEPTLGL